MCDTSPFSSSPVLDALAASVVAEDTAPDAAVAWGRLRADGTWRVARGGSRRLFDLASVTKSFTAVAAALSGMGSATRLGLHLPELSTSASGDASLAHLLSHRAGLEAHLELFAPLRGGTLVDPGAALRQAANARRPECAGIRPLEGFPVVYSDLGYLLAGAALARHVGTLDAGAAIEELLLQPLGLGAELGTARSLGPLADYAITETTTWRSPDPLRGIVHDENAFALTGRGGSGHAGLFGTAAAVVRFGLAVLQLLRGGGPLATGGPPPTWLVEPRPGSTWRAGFDGKSATGSSAGASASAASFGHLGFTGTSLWIDPVRSVVTCLTCNRVAPSRDRLPASGGIRATRPRVHDALFRIADEQA